VTADSRARRLDQTLSDAEVRSPRKVHSWRVATRCPSTSRAHGRPARWAVGYSEREMFRLLRQLYDRMGVRNRTEALLKAAQCGPAVSAAWPWADVPMAQDRPEIGEREP
jgi:hypothetical protein